MKNFLLLISFIVLSHFASAVCSVNGIALQNVLCNGQCNGVAYAIASGGTAPYTYSWSPAGGNNQTASNLCAATYTVVVNDAVGCFTATQVVITQPTALTANASTVTNVSCYGGSNGSATVAANGGTPAYIYLWSPSGGNTVTANNLTAGTYTVTVTDSHGCTITYTTVITQPTVLTAAASTVTNVSCNGGNDGSATVAANNGSPAYTYLWSPSGGTGQTANNLAAGTYTVTVTDSHGCTATSTAFITEPTVLAAAASTVTNVSCNGGNNGSATVAANNGSPAYTYLWSPSGGTGQTASNLGAGSYTVTVTDSHGCTITSTAIITQPALLTSSITAQTNVLCNGGSNGSATVIPVGGTGVPTYSWNTAPVQTTSTATGLAAGTYTVTDANNCITTSSVTITQPTILAASCTSLSSSSAYITAAGGTGAYTYTWMPSGQNTSTATNLSSGNYTCCVTDGNGCSTCCNAIVNSVNEIAEESEIFSIYPNPFHSSATLLIKSEAIIQNAELIIYDMLGNEVQKSQIRNHQSEITNLPPGIYLLKIEGIKGRVVKKLIVY
jgi:hypothetical protein